MGLISFNLKYILNARSSNAMEKGHALLELYFFENGINSHRFLNDLHDVLSIGSYINITGRASLKLVHSFVTTFHWIEVKDMGNRTVPWIIIGNKGVTDRGGYHFEYDPAFLKDVPFSKEMWLYLIGTKRTLNFLNGIYFTGYFSVSKKFQDYYESNHQNTARMTDHAALEKLLSLNRICQTYFYTLLDDVVNYRVSITVRGRAALSLIDNFIQEFPAVKVCFPHCRTETRALFQERGSKIIFVNDKLKWNCELNFFKGIRDFPVNTANKVGLWSYLLSMARELKHVGKCHDHCMNLLLKNARLRTYAVRA